MDRQALYSGLFAALAAAPLAPFLEGHGEPEAGGPGSPHGLHGRGGGARNGVSGPGGLQGIREAGKQPRVGFQARGPQARGPVGAGGGAGAGWAAEPTPVLLAAAATTLLVDQVCLGFKLDWCTSFCHSGRVPTSGPGGQGLLQITE